MKTYENPGLGIAFEYPSEWVLVYNCRVRYGVDVLMTHGFTNFGIMMASDKIKNDVIYNIKTLHGVLRSTVQLRAYPKIR